MFEYNCLLEFRMQYDLIYSSMVIILYELKLFSVLTFSLSLPPSVPGMTVSWIFS